MSRWDVFVIRLFVLLGLLVALANSWLKIYTQQVHV